jgi:hypothetical protein
MHDDFLLFFSITLGLLLGAGLLHLLPRMGQTGRRLSEAACRAPLLDVIVCYFTILPLIIGPLVAGWAGLFIAVIAQLATLLIWQTIHEAVHRDTAKGPRIIKALNKKFGPIRYLTAAYPRDMKYGSTKTLSQYQEQFRLRGQQGPSQTCLPIT